MIAQFLRDVSRYFGRVRRSLAIGSCAGILMNMAARICRHCSWGAAIDSALAFLGAVKHPPRRWQGRRCCSSRGTLASEGPRILKRWFLITANARIRADLRADSIRGVLGWPMARVDRTPVGEQIAPHHRRTWEVVGVGVREGDHRGMGHGPPLRDGWAVMTLAVKSPGLSLVAPRTRGPGHAGRLDDGRDAWPAARRPRASANGKPDHGHPGSRLRACGCFECWGGRASSSSGSAISLGGRRAGQRRDDASSLCSAARLLAADRVRAPGGRLGRESEKRDRRGHVGRRLHRLPRDLPALHRPRAPAFRS